MTEGPQSINFPIRWYLSGLPKSGIHLLEAMIGSVANPRVPGEDDFWAKPWVSSFDRNAWSDEWLETQQICHTLSMVEHATYFKGHCGYRPDIASFVYLMGICHIFIYRDLRDVAVSQAYHVVAESDKKFAHPGKALYRPQCALSA